MKTPKEKAQQIVSKYTLHVAYKDEMTKMENGTLMPLPSKMPLAKICAMETVDLIMNAVLDATGDELGGPHALYWGMVKREIEQL